ncbi:MAG: [LysW]-aminoadipate kinase [Anaerolineae bacterium]|jgi:acetylglutamate/LysW-gamma-L-alpha-aminoadipate kinase|nr:[LysW]-aminoadipate kinase [Chloroflexota bacterium]
MIVVKVGGSEGIDLDAVCRDIATLVRDGQPMVLVHGGSHRTNEVATALGYPPRFVTSLSGFTSRRTDRETLRIFEMVYCGEVNKGIVERLQALGVNAVGLSGLDGRLLEGKRKPALRVMEQGRRMVIRDDYTGTVDTVNTDLLQLLLGNGYFPVVSPPGISADSEAINVDGDRAAARIAAALGADQLLILSNVPGLLRDVQDENSLITSIDPARADEMMQHAEGRMRIKVLGALEALQDGVGRVVFGDARLEQPVTRALGGQGTVIGTRNA